MYYNNNTDAQNLRNPSINEQQFNRDKESSDDGEFSEMNYKMPYMKSKEHMTKKSCNCCTYFNPMMGCMYQHPYSMYEQDDPVMGEQYENDDPPFFPRPFFPRPFFPMPFFHEHFFPRPFFPAHFHHHFFRQPY